jgi:hypothetical protein
LFQRGFGDVASVDGACALGEEGLRAVELELLQGDVRFVAGDGLSRRLDILLGDVKLTHLGVERRLRNHDLLRVVGVVDAGEHRSRLHLRALVERKFDDARLHGLEAHDALVRLDVAGDEDVFRPRSPSHPGGQACFNPRRGVVLVTEGRESAQPENNRSR